MAHRGMWPSAAAGLGAGQGHRRGGNRQAHNHGSGFSVHTASHSRESRRPECDQPQDERGPGWVSSCPKTWKPGDKNWPTSDDT